MHLSTNPRPALYLPLLTPLARAISQDIHIVFHLLVIALTVLAFAVKTWGAVALTMAALPLVLVMFVLMVILTKP